MKEIAQKVSGGCRSLSGFQGSDPRRCDDITTIIMLPQLALYTVYMGLLTDLHCFASMFHLISMARLVATRLLQWSPISKQFYFIFYLLNRNFYSV